MTAVEKFEGGSHALNQRIATLQKGTLSKQGLQAGIWEGSMQGRIQAGSWWLRLEGLVTLSPPAGADDQ